MFNERMKDFLGTEIITTSNYNLFTSSRPQFGYIRQSVSMSKSSKGFLEEFNDDEEQILSGNSKQLHFGLVF